MYQQQGKSMQASTRMSERQLYLQGGGEDSGLVLSTDAKPRLKWTPDLQSVLEKAQETLGGQNMGTIGIEAAKVQLSDLASKVSTQCLNSAFPQLSDLCLHPKQTTQAADCSIDSCLTSSCEGASRRDQELYNNLVGMKPAALSFGHKDNLRWRDDVKDGGMFEEKSYNLSIGIGVEADAKFYGDGGEDLMKTHKTTSDQMKLPLFSTKLDLNTDDAASSCKHLDLNGFSWT